MLIRAFALFGCFVTASAVITRSAHSEATPIRAPLAQFPMRLDDWRGVQEPPYDRQVLNVLGVDDYLTRTYFRSSQAGVGLYIGYYQSQRQGDTIHSPLNCLPGSGWEPLSKSTLPILVPNALADPSPRQIRVNRYLVQKGLDRQLVLYWYQSHGRIVASEYASRLYLIGDAVRLNRTDGALVRVITPAGPDVEDAEGRAERTAVQFVKALFPRLAEYLPL
jgi:EpsI family protein